MHNDSGAKVQALKITPRKSRVGGKFLNPKVQVGKDINCFRHLFSRM